MTRLQGKIALVTGGSAGIGRAIAMRLAAEGAAVAVNYGHSKEPAEAVVAEIEAAGGKAVAIGADVTDVAAARQLVDDTVAQFGSLDILVNNAGRGTLGPIGDVTEEHWDEIFALNAKAPYFVTQAASGHLGERGCVVFVSSSTASFPMKDTALYAASKIVVRTYAETLAKEFGPRGITVNSVIPGPTAPGMFANAPEELQKMAAGMSPFDRIGHPDDIAGVVAFLASDDARWVSGQNILANGAATM